MLVCPTCYAEYKEAREQCARDATPLAPLIAEPLRGHILDRKYRLEARLGSGGMAVVYRATRITIGDSAAVKILNRNVVGDEAGYRRFEQEARLAASVKHPNVVSVYDFGTTEHHTAYLVMEYLEGPTLSQELRRYGGLSLERAMEIFEPVCAAVTAAHKEGLIHRDLKPNNIILQQLKRGDEYVKVVDFGIAKLIDDSSRLNQHLSGGTIFGTLGYMPREQLVGQPLDARADVYSLAVTLYQMLAARLPFIARNVVELYKEMSTRGPRSLRERRPDLPVAIERVIFRALSPNRDKRPDTPLQLFQALKLAVRRARQRAGHAIEQAKQANADRPVVLPEKGAEVYDETVPYQGSDLTPPLTRGSGAASAQTESRSDDRSLTLKVEPLSQQRAPVVSQPDFERFAAREAELVHLRQHYERAAEARALPIIIVGEPGIGKSQLMAEHRRWAEVQGAITRSARFFDYGGNQLEPYQIFLDMLAGLIDADEGGPGAGRAKIVKGEVKAPLMTHVRTGLLNELLARAGVDTTRTIEKWRIFEAITDAFKQLAGPQPSPARVVLLLFEDLQWADSLSLELLGYIMRNSAGSRLQIVASAREEEAETEGQLLREWLIEQSRYRSYEMVKLPPFTRIETRALLETIFGQIQVADSELDRLHSETQGNPYFLCEVLRLLMESGNLRMDERGWRLMAIDELELPASITNLVSLKLRRFSAQELDVFVQAAVIGDEFSFETLYAMTGIDETELEAILAKGVQGWVLQELSRLSADDFRFYHTTIRRVLYNSVAKRHRKKLHASAAAALERVYRSHPARAAAALAYHYFLAMNWQMAFDYGAAAGDAAHAQQAMQAAARYYEWADEAAAQLAAAGQPPDIAREFRMRINYTDALTVLGQVTASEAQATKAAELAMRSRRMADRAWANYMLSRVAQTRGDFHSANTYALKGLDEAAAAGGGEVERRLLQQRGYLSLMLGMLSESQTALERCQQLAQSTGDVKTAGWALSLMGLTLANMGNQQRGLRAALAGVEMLRSAGDRMGELVACERIGIIYDVLGQYEAALTWYQQGLTLARTLAYRKQELTLLINIGENYRLQGQFDQAEQNYRQGLALAQELDHRDVQSTAIQNLGLVALDRGDYQEAAAQLGQALAMHRAQGRQNPEAEVLCDLGRTRAGLGDHRDALDLYKASLQLCKKIPYPDYEWRALFGMARCYLQLGERKSAAEAIKAAVAVIERLRVQLPIDTDLDLFMRDKRPVYELQSTI